MTIAFWTYPRIPADAWKARKLKQRKEKKEAYSIRSNVSYKAGLQNRETVLLYNGAPSRVSRLKPRQLG